MATKILVTGDVSGHFDSLFARVTKVHTSKAGPFHALFCVGAFFGRKGDAELNEFIQGKKQVPLPTYFIGGDEFHTHLLDALPSGGTLCPNLHYLGRSGVSALELGGKKLNVAFLSGIYDQSSYFHTSQSTGGVRNTKYQPHYIEEDVVNVLSQGVKSEIDILLTCEWGKAWNALLPSEKVPESLRASLHAHHGSPVVAKLASQLSARYHFAGTFDTYFELPPYRSRLFITRFFGLGAHDSASKQKSLYACNVAPFSMIDKNAIPPETTPCPYTVGAAKPQAAASSSSSSSSSSSAPIASAATSAVHPFPSDVNSNKRQKLDAGAYSDPRAAASADDGVGLATHRWNFAKPERGPPPQSYVCRICQNATGSHWIEDCPQKSDRSSRDNDIPPPDYVCRKCNQGGHYIRLCPLIDAEKSAPRPAGSLPPGYICRVCNEPGHRITDCPTVKKEQAERAARGQQPRTSLLGAPPAGGARQLDANGMPLGTKQDCWFCLATEHVATHLILSVGNENYLASAKGALNEEHLLILPIVHVASSLDLTAEQSTEMDKYKNALRRYYRSRGMECLMYERFIPTRAAQHMHIQVIPITRGQAQDAKASLISQAATLSDQLTFQEIPKSSTLMQANPGKQPFVLFEFPSFDEMTDSSSSSSSASAASASSPPPSNDFPLTRMIHYVQSYRGKIPGLFDFPRTFAATLIGRPELSDWKKVTRTDAEETDLVEKMKTTFAPFDFTLVEDEQGQQQGSSEEQKMQ